MGRGSLVAIVLVLVPGATLAQPAEGPWQRLWQGDAPGAQGQDPADVPVYVLYRAASDKANGTAVVVCPGGGYATHALNHEGHDIAKWWNSLGVTAVVLKYRLGPRYRHPAPLTDAQRAIRLTRHHAKEWGIDPRRVGIMGFSAGGHLASTAGTHFDLGTPEADDPIDRHSCRPDFLVLLYPVITMTEPFAHVGSRNNLLGKKPDPKLVEQLSTERRVTAATPPTFLVHTTEDKAVPPENSVLFYLALCKHKVPAELHIYEKGRHGLGLGDGTLPYASWPQRCAAWLHGRGLLDMPKQ
ncbi:MAG: alpha/beta hydrolase [Gemmataceae bacterium]|nr:alpha/beta hydrolase [Gemmataceae bacterium]